MVSRISIYQVILQIYFTIVGTQTETTTTKKADFIVLVL